MEKTDYSPFFFFALFTTLFLAIFYNTATNMAGIYIVSDLGGSIHISVYAMVFYSLGNVLTIPLAKPLADRFGPIKILIYGLILYSFFSILCSLAPTFVLLNLFRFGMGLPSGLFYVLCRRVLLVASPPERIPHYTLIMILMYAIVPVLGATFGAWLAYEGIWRTIFHVNEPIALYLAAYFWICYRKTDHPTGLFFTFDKIGYLFFAIGISALLTAAALSQELDWYRSPILCILTAVGVPSLLFFILWELRSPTPLLELQLLRSPLLSFSLLNLAILFSAYFGMIILITLWLNIYVNYTPWWVTALIATMGIAGLISFLVSKSFLARFDPRWTLAIAILCFTSSCYYSTYFNVDVDFFHLVVARFLAGVGLVLFLVPLLQLCLASYGLEKSAAIFCQFQLVRALFSGLGSSLYVILWQRRQVFFHERLGENITIYSQLTIDYFRQAVEVFHLTKEQAVAQLEVFLDQHATSLALNDVFGFMGYLLAALLALLFLSFLKKDMRPLSE